MRRVLPFAVLLLGAALLVIPAALLATNPGTRWLVSRAESVLPLKISALSGTLISAIDIAGLTWLGDNFELQADELSFKLDLRCLIRSALCIESLDARQLTLRSEAGEDRAGGGGAPWEILADLPSIEVRQARVSRFHWESDGSDQQLDGLTLRGAIDGRSLSLEHLAACHAQGCADLRGAIDVRGRWRVAGRVDPAPPLLQAEALALPASYRLRADGDPVSAELQVSAGPGTVAGELRYADPARASGSFRIEGLDQLVPVLAEQRIYPLSGPLALELTRRPDMPLPIVELRQDLQGPDNKLLPLAARLLPGEAGLTLETLTLGAGEAPRLRGSGYLAYDDQTPSRVSVEAARWRMPEALGLSGLVASGAASLEFTMDALQTNWSAAASRLVLIEDDRTWQVDGTLEASPDLLFPVGDLALSLWSPSLTPEEPLRLTYGRQGSDSPARINSVESVQVGGLRLTALETKVTPGVPLAIDLELAGDVSTRLQATVALRDGRVRVHVQPFFVTWARERFAVRDGATFAWKQQSRAFDLQALCVAWQGSAVCSDGGPIGSDGELDLRVTLDEVHEGFLGDNPYAIAARGEGRATVTWRDWQPHHARLDVAFDELALDPFVGSETAQPVRWEKATISGAIDAQGVGQLEAVLASPQFGGLSASLSTGEQQLEGSLRSTALSLTAFRDLVPSWRIDAGTLRSDLRLSGTPAEPQINGDLALRDGQLRIPALDLQLESLRLDARVDGRRVALQGQALAGGGALHLEARCCDGERIEGLLIGDRNRLQMENGLDATISPSLDFSVAPNRLSSSGSLTVHSGVFEHSGLVEGGVALSPDVRRLDAPEAAPDRFDLDLNLRTLIQPGFTLRSERIEATLAGDLRFLAPPNQPPSLFGNLEVLGGELRAYGQALRLTEGDLGFVGDPLNPDLSISAEREIRSDNQRVGFRVTGTLEEPRFDLFSDPQRSDNETLSYLIRGRGPDVGVSADGTAMALSLGASALNQSGVLAPLNELPGLSGVTLGAEGTDEDMSATISAYVGNRLYLSYGVGIYEPINALTARLYLRSRLWLEVVSRLENSFDLYYRFDRD